MRATFWTQRPDRQEPLGARWRVDIPARHLPAETVVYDGEFEVERQRGETAIFVKPHLEAAMHAFNAAKCRGLRAVVEVDDAWIAIDPRLLALIEVELAADPEELERAEQVHREGQERHIWIARQADAVIVSTEALAELYRALNPNVIVCPNSIDVDDWPAELREQRQPGPFRVGFAGSTSHGDDLPLARDAFAWASEQPGVEVRFCGWHPRDPSPTWETEAARGAFEEMLAILQRSLDESPDGKIAPEAIRAGDAAIDAAKAKIAERQAQWNFPLEVIPWTEDAESYRRNLASLDVILCPIDDLAPFSGGRSDLKILESAACGVLPIVSDSPIYAAWRGVVPMARSSGEFVELVRWAVTHRDEVRERAAVIWAHVLEHRTIDETIGRWREACVDAAPVAA